MVVLMHRVRLQRKLLQPVLGLQLALQAQELLLVEGQPLEPILQHRLGLFQKVQDRQAQVDLIGLVMVHLIHLQPLREELLDLLEPHLQRRNQQQQLQLPIGLKPMEPPMVLRMVTQILHPKLRKSQEISSMLQNSILSGTLATLVQRKLQVLAYHRRPHLLQHRTRLHRLELTPKHHLLHLVSIVVP